MATIAHPLNRARIDPRTGRILEGYGVIQPRVGTEPVSARRSLYARIMAGPAGIDPYTTAVSDVYQDLFGEGSYVGKAIYDVEAFAQALDGRVPENRLLSHDLFEGIYARTALATDIELIDDQPASYSVVAGRQHRWIRGDWQLLAWLWTHVPVSGGGGGATISRSSRSGSSSTICDAAWCRRISLRCCSSAGSAIQPWPWPRRRRSAASS